MEKQHDELTDTGVIRVQRTGDETLVSWVRNFIERTSEPLDHDALVRKVMAS